MGASGVTFTEGDFVVVYAEKFIFSDIEGDIEIIQEYAEDRCHRLRCGNVCGSVQNYEAFCYLTLPHGRFVGATEFWATEWAPVSRIVLPMPTPATDISATEPVFTNGSGDTETHPVPSESTNDHARQLGLSMAEYEEAIAIQAAEGGFLSDIAKRFDKHERSSN